MVFGGAASERLQLNKDTRWTGGPYDPVNPAVRDATRGPPVDRCGKFAEAQVLDNAQVMGVPKTQMAYQPLGDLLLALPGATGPTSDYRRQLDLDAAIATTQFTAGGTRFVRDVFASPGDQAMLSATD